MRIKYAERKTGLPIVQPMIKDFSFPERETFFFPGQGLGELNDPGPLGLGTLGEEQALVASALEDNLKDLAKLGPMPYDASQVLEDIAKYKRLGCYKPCMWCPVTIPGRKYQYFRGIGGMKRPSKNRRKKWRKSARSMAYSPEYREAFRKLIANEPLSLSEMVFVHAKWMKRMKKRRKKASKRRKIGWSVVAVVGVAAAVIFLGPLLFGGAASATSSVAKTGGSGTAKGVKTAASVAKASKAAAEPTETGPGWMESMTRMGAKAAAKGSAKKAEKSKPGFLEMIFAKAMSAGEKKADAMQRAAATQAAKKAGQAGRAPYVPAVTRPAFALPKISPLTIALVAIPVVALPLIIMAIKK